MTIVRDLPRIAPEPSEHTLTLRDGTDLFYRAWLPERPTTKALLLFHRGHEHSGRWQETVAAHVRTITQVFGHAIAPRAIDVRSFTRTANTPERSFMRSSLADRAEAIVAALKGAVARGIAG